MNISAPGAIDPVQGAKIAVAQQPITLVVDNATTTGVRPLSYLFEVAADANFSNKVFVRDAVAPGSGRTTMRLPDPLPSGRSYYWRARAADGANTGPYTNTTVFDVFTPIVIDKPIPVAPIGDVLLTNVLPQYVVNNAARSGPIGSMFYEMELADTATFANRLGVLTFPEQATQTKFASPGGLPYSKQIFWRVRAFDSGNNIGPWSDLQVFRTPAAPATPAPGGGSSGSPCGPPYPNNGPNVVTCVQSQYPNLLKPVGSLHERETNMAFLRDRVIETGICGGLDLALNRKQSGAISIDAIVYRHDGRDDVIDIGFAYDTPNDPFHLQWIVVGGAPGYVAFSPRPSCR